MDAPCGLLRLLFLFAVESIEEDFRKLTDEMDTLSAERIISGLFTSCRICKEGPCGWNSQHRGEWWLKTSRSSFAYQLRITCSQEQWFREMTLCADASHDLTDSETLFAEVPEGDTS